MLVLTRNIGERVIIDNNITLTVTSVKGNQVQLGFDTPSHVPINREEIHNHLSHSHHAAKKFNKLRSGFIQRFARMF